MKRYDSDTPRVACAIAAMTLTAITIGLLVVLPSRMEADSQIFLMAMAEGIATKPCIPRGGE